jgi:hypothetical protein
MQIDPHKLPAGIVWTANRGKRNSAVFATGWAGAHFEAVFIDDFELCRNSRVKTTNGRVDELFIT